MTRHPFLWLSSLAALILAGAANADPSRVVPGSQAIDTRHLQPYRALTAWGEQRLVAGEVDGRPTWNLVNMVLGAPNPLVDHIVLDRNTLELMGRYAPYFAIGKHYLAATIADGRLSATLNPLSGGDRLAFDTDLGEPVFEEAALALLLASLPLAVGYEASVPRLGISAASGEFLVGTMDLRVSDRTRIVAGDGETYDAWVVEADWSGVDYHEVHYIADTPPYSLKKTATMPDGRRRESGFESVSAGGDGRNR